MLNKKIILFIVEGVNDKTSLALCLNDLLVKCSVHFEIMNGDITTKIGSNAGNIASKIGIIVKNFSGKIFKPKDFLEVIHLIDMDGTFVPDESIVLSDNEKIIYSDDCIITSNVDGLIRRNAQKVEVVNRMLAINKIWGSIPYRVYYFSCNMDHILHENANLTKAEKNQLASAFENKYYGKSDDFIGLFNNGGFAVKSDYKQSWEFIKMENNSLKRYSNFCLYLNDKQNDKQLML